jgi:hypothetical protein
MCTEALVDRTIEPGESLEEWMAFLGDLGPSEYTTGASFTTVDPSTGSAFYGSDVFTLTE